MYVKKRGMADRLVAAKLAITNALAETDIKDVLSELGFDEVRLQAGLELYNRTEKLYQEQKREYSGQYAATEEFNKAWKEAKDAYKKYATAAKLALWDSTTLLNGLGLNRGRPLSISDSLTRGRLFYASSLASPEIQEELQIFAVTPEDLQGGLDLVNRAEALFSRQQVKMSEAQQATRDRDEAFTELDRFMFTLTRVARVLLTEKPEHLEKMGILERSAPIPKKKEPVDEETAPEPVPEPVNVPVNVLPETPVFATGNKRRMS